MRRITILAPRLPPARGGVGEHSLHLARHLLGRGHAVGLIARRAPAAAEGLPDVPIELWNGGTWSLLECLRRQQTYWLWLQLSGYGYSRFGAPWLLGRALRRIRRELPDLRMAVYVHETHCLPSALGWKGPLLSRLQRWTVGRIARLGDVVFSSNPAQLGQVMDDYRVARGRVSLLPIGSNVPAVTLSPARRAAIRGAWRVRPWDTVAATFGSWGMQVGALERHAQWLGGAVRCGRIGKIVCVGGEPGPVPRAMARWREQEPYAGRVMILGHRRAEEVAEILGACDLGLVEPMRTMMCKSGGFVAMAVNGLPVVVDGEGDPGYGLGTLAGCLSPEKFLAEDPSKDRLAAWGAAMRRLAGCVFDWDAIADEALTRMDLV